MVVIKYKKIVGMKDKNVPQRSKRGHSDVEKGLCRGQGGVIYYKRVQIG